jgi:hypothetical protein
MNLSITNDDLVTIHRSLANLKEHTMPFNDHALDLLLAKIDRIIISDQQKLLVDLENSMKQLEFRVKYCKHNDLLFDLESWEYLYNHSERQLKYVTNWLNEIEKTAP